MNAKSIEELSEFLEKNGFTITDSISFYRSLKDKDINDFINSLVSTKNSSFDFDYIGFANKFNEKMNVLDDISNKLGNLEMSSVIDNILNTDETVKFGDPSILKEFKETINRIKNNFSAINEYLIAKKDMINKRGLFIRATKEIYDIEKDNSLSKEEKTSKTLIALQYKNLYKEDYLNSLKIFKDKENSLKGYNIVNFKNDLIKDLNSLDSIYPKLPFSDENKNNLKTAINELRELTVIYDSKTISATSELDKICSRYGIDYDEAKDIYKSNILADSLDNNSKDIEADKSEKAVKYNEENSIINNKVFSLLSNNGFYINNPVDFAKGIGSKNIDEFARSLIDVKNSSNFFDFLGFSKEFDKKIGVLTNINLETGNIDKTNTIDSLFDNDEMVKYGNSEKLKIFNNAIESIKMRFFDISQFYVLEQNMLRAKSELNKAQKELFKLSKDSNLSPNERTKKALALTSQIQYYKNSYKEATKAFYDRQEAIKSINVEEFKNGLNNDLNILYNTYSSLPFTPENKEKINQILGELKELVFTYDLSAIKAKSELNKICENYGLTYEQQKDLSKTINNLSSNLDNSPNLGGSSLSNNNLSNNPTDNKSSANIEKLESGLNNSEDNLSRDSGVDILTESENDLTSSNDGSANNNSSNATDSNNNSSSEGNSSGANDSNELDESEKSEIEKEAEKLIEDLSHQEETGPKIKVVAKKAWTWTKNHKKQILIAIGISLLIVTAIIALQGILPSIPALTQASNISTTCSCMLNNASLMNGVAAAQQASLQGANTILASTLQNLTGSSVVLNGAGTWSVGGQSLATFAAKAAADYNALLAPMIKMGNVATALGLGGIASVAGGILLPNKEKSSGFKNINKKINDLFESVSSLERNDAYLKCKDILLLTKQSPTMSEAEKKIIIKKVKKCLKEADEKCLRETNLEQLNATNSMEAESLYEEAKGGR